MNCEPEIIESYREFDCFDDEGNMETSVCHVYNCHECDEEECKYWKEYN